ncbi:hypothetical protein GE061_020253 [Apolygus lucorum]|uniref:CCHC-type domain-containing protein n=1 Tax=Apolygus lucorum TaxID=248454 RepID=A0A8S9WI14_APOLU|nr:hypothetical protein GE061_020253 [Apolygus lucorum]
MVISYSDATSGRAAGGDGSWTGVGRRGRAVNLQATKQTQMAASTPARAKSISQVKADIRARIRGGGGPQPSTDSRTLIVTGDEDVMKKLSSSVDPKGLGLEIRTTRSIRGGGVILEIEGQVDVDALQKNPAITSLGLAIKEAPSKCPRVLIHGVPSSLTPEELQDEFWKSNCVGTDEDLKAGAFVPIHRAGPKNLPETKWVVQVSQAVRSTIIQDGRVRLGWLVCRVVDHISVSRCYRCQKFGHVAKSCGSGEVCGWCTERGHSFRACTRKQQPARCVNCMEAGRVDHHDAGSLECPSYRIAMEHQVRLTDYGKDD